MATAESKPSRVENKALLPDETKPAAPADEVKVELAHHWTDDDNENHKPGETVTVPGMLGRSMAAQGFGKLKD